MPSTTSSDGSIDRFRWDRMTVSIALGYCLLVASELASRSDRSRHAHPRNGDHIRPVHASVPDWMLDVLLPRTDAGVYVQWAIAAPLWIMGLFATRHWSKDVRLLLWGLATVNLAWFMIRMAH